jgi:hypothetical protein
MMVEQVVLTTIFLGWLFYRFAIREEERQSLLDLAARRGVALTVERAARAAAAGTSGRLRQRLVAHGVDGDHDTAESSNSPGHDLCDDVVEQEDREGNG